MMSLTLSSGYNFFAPIFGKIPQMSISQKTLDITFLSPTMPIVPILETYTKHLQTIGKSAHTVKAYAHDLGGFAQWFTQTTGEAFDPQAIGPRDIAAYRSFQLTRGKKPATVNRRLVALQRFYKWAQQHGHTTNSPFEALEGVRVKQQQGMPPKWLDQNQQRTLL